MDPIQSLSLAFIVVGVILFIAEVGSPGTFMIVPGTVLLILGAMGLIEPDLLVSWWSPLIVTIVLIPLTYLTIKLYQRLAPPAPPETIVATSLLGKTGTVTSQVHPGNLRGKVRIESDTWSATSERIIPKGVKVIVRNSEGVHVFVEEIGDQSNPLSSSKENNS